MLRAVDHRGPDGRGIERVGSFWLGHTRLAILGLGPGGAQPYRRGRVVLTYNGELWNHRELRTELEALGETFRTTCDTEVVAAALDAWGADALPRMNGMFSLGWVADGVLRVARDRFGEVPLHVEQAAPQRFASEVRALLAAGAHPGSIGWVGPGEVFEATRGGWVRRSWYAPPVEPSELTLAEAALEVGELIRRGCVERAIADVPVCALLSGGVDSAAVVACLATVVPDLVAFVAVMDERSPDVRAARLVAEALGVELREVRVRSPDADDLARVVEAIEMPYKAQVEIGWACLALADRIRADGFKVTFSGEGSDELWASYGFAYHWLKTQDWHAYRRDLFFGQHRKNFARCNKVFMARGVECRLPFLHPPLVERALSLTRGAVADGRGRPKAVLQDAFRGKLPERVLTRKKLAFQDGLGLKSIVERAVADPRRFYAAEHRRAFRGVKP